MIQTSQIEHLLSLLQEEREALLSGNYDRLERLADAKEKAVKAIQTQTMPRGILSNLQKRLERNLAMLGAASEGIRDARQRLAQLQSGHATQMYDRLGGSRTIRPPHHELEHKA